MSRQHEANLAATGNWDPSDAASVKAIAVLRSFAHDCIQLEALMRSKLNMSWLWFLRWSLDGFL